MSSQLVTIPCSMGYLRVRIPRFDWASSLVTTGLVSTNFDRQSSSRTRHKNLSDPYRPSHPGDEVDQQLSCTTRTRLDIGMASRELHLREDGTRRVVTYNESVSTVKLYGQISST